MASRVSAQHRLRLDRHDLPAVQAPRQLGLLRLARSRARLRRRRRNLRGAAAAGARYPGIWNPLPNFETVRLDRQLGNIESTSNFYAAAENGTLPSVSWIVPNAVESEHAPGLVSDGMSYVTGLISAVMRSPDWDSTAIFLIWDDWGGFYDSVVPPRVDENGYGLRVPGIQPPTDGQIHGPRCARTPPFSAT